MTGFLQRQLFGEKRKAEAERVLLEAVLEELARAKDAARVLIMDYEKAVDERDDLRRELTGYIAFLETRMVTHEKRDETVSGAAVPERL